MSKTILVTGGSRGIGRAVALKAASFGWGVAVGFRADRDAADSVVATITRADGDAVAIQADVAVEEDVVRMFDAAEHHLGPLDGVVINAGIVAPSLPLAEMEEPRLRRMLEVNVLGALLCAREAVRRLTRDVGGGSIVLVSSTAARLGAPGEYVDYAASKAAVDALGIGLAREVARSGIRVNVVRPGIIETELHASGGQADRAERLGREVPIGRPGFPDEVAEAIVWLLGDGASYTTGSVLDVAGGR